MYRFLPGRYNAILEGSHNVGELFARFTALDDNAEMCRHDVAIDLVSQLWWQKKELGLLRLGWDIEVFGMRFVSICWFQEGSPCWKRLLLRLGNFES